MITEEYMELCKELVDVHDKCLKDQEHEQELRAKVLEHSEDDSNVPMGKFTITFSPETTCARIDPDKLRAELRVKFHLSKGQIACLIGNSETESVRARHIVIKETVKIKFKTHTAPRAA